MRKNWHLLTYLTVWLKDFRRNQQINDQTMLLISKFRITRIKCTSIQIVFSEISFYFLNRGGTLKKVKSLRVLDSKVAQNLSILLVGPLKHLKYEDVKKSILKCDVSVLSANILEQLILYLPPPDQLKRLEQFKADYNDLTEAEQFAVTVIYLISIYFCKMK